MTDTTANTRKGTTTRKPKTAASATNVKPVAADAGAPTPPTAKQPAKPESKIARVIGLLQRAEGATLEEMIVATGWLPHTTRAALTGLKKKGHAVTRDKRGEVTCYRIVAAA